MVERVPLGTFLKVTTVGFCLGLIQRKLKQIPESENDVLFSNDTSKLGKHPAYC